MQFLYPCGTDFLNLSPDAGDDPFNILFSINDIFFIPILL